MDDIQAWERLARDVGEYGTEGLTAAAMVDLATAVLTLAWQVIEARAWAWATSIGCPTSTSTSRRAG